MKSLLPFLYGADGNFSIMALLAFIALVVGVLFLVKRVPPLKAAVAG